jgi:hypothetical protein
MCVQVGDMLEAAAAAYPAEATLRSAAQLMRLAAANGVSVAYARQQMLVDAVSALTRPKVPAALLPSQLGDAVAATTRFFQQMVACPLGGVPPREGPVPEWMLTSVRQAFCAPIRPPAVGVAAADEVAAALLSAWWDVYDDWVQLGDRLVLVPFPTATVVPSTMRLVVDCLETRTGRLDARMLRWPLTATPAGWVVTVPAAVAAVSVQKVIDGMFGSDDESVLFDLGSADGCDEELIVTAAVLAADHGERMRGMEWVDMARHFQ